MKQVSKLLSAFFAAAVITGCGSSGGSGTTDSKGQQPGSSGPQEEEVTLAHGRGFVCTQRDLSVYCWAYEELAVTNGDAAYMGLTSTVPVLMMTLFNPGPVTWHTFDRGIALTDSAGNYRTLGTASGSTSNSYMETATCEVISSTELNCPSDATSDLTFAKLFPESWHTPTYRAVRKTALREGKNPWAA